MNVVTQLTQFVGRDDINKNTTVQLGQLSSVELCRYNPPPNVTVTPIVRYRALTHELATLAPRTAW